MSRPNLHSLATPREITFEFIRVVWSRKFLILLVFLATVLSAYAYVQLMTERYLSEATLLVRIGRENTELPVSVARGQVTTLGVRPEEINSNVTLLKSRFLITEVVDEVGIEAFESEPPEPQTFFEQVKHQVRTAWRWVKAQYKEFLIWAKLQKRLTPRQETIDYVHQFLEVDRVRESDTIRVALQLPDAELAKRCLSLLLERYFERHADVRSMALTGDFFEQQVALYRGELDQLDQQLMELRGSGELSSIERERGLLLDRLAKIEEELDEHRSQLTMLPGSGDRTGAAAESESEAEAGSEIAQFPVFRSDKLSEVALEKYLDRLGIVSVQGDSGAQLDSIDEQTRRIERELRGGLQRRIQQLSSWKAELSERLAVLNTGEVNLEKLERERLLSQQNLFKYNQRLEDERIAEELDQQRIANVTVLTPPTAEFSPIYPKKKLYMAVAVIGGLVAALGFALILAYLDDTIRQPRDAAAIEGIEVLGTVKLPSRRKVIQEVTPQASSVAS